MSEEAKPAGPAQDASHRLQSIDIARGLVMAIMALDHVRDYFSTSRADLMDPEKTTIGIFLTRWLSHYCAPAFFLLAGIGVYLSLSRGKPRATQAKHLFLRGLVLLILDLTVIRVAWDFNFHYSSGPWFIVLSTLGLSMMILAGLQFLPYWAVLIFSIALIAGHNAFDFVDWLELGAWEPLWYFLHVRSTSEVAGFSFYISYPLVPWVAVMSLGYCLGPIFLMEGPRRRQSLFFLGAAMTLGFAMLRGTNAYGDPRPWTADHDGVFNFLALLRTKKYPPSLHYLLMCLGPLLMLMPALESPKGRLTNVLSKLGRAPLFFYILHIYVAHALAVLAGAYRGYSLREFLVPYTSLPEDYGFRLPVVYAVWLLVLAVCYPACVWFADLKRRSKSKWLAYL
ncbi:MAG: heparan-alpha-glucosaminide N-acetyltransferase domain-containing protein [Gemmataceae bacterium]|nr:heparan-alpha-glucosaminide N-acetyltransferase domain-containing protein [Gemmataceae bacterium]